MKHRGLNLLTAHLGTPSRVRPRLLYLVTEDWYFCGHRMDLARGARDSGYDVVVATQVSDHADEITREGFKLIPIQLSRRNRDPIADMADIIELVGIYRKEKPDIVHHVGMKPIVYGSWAARFLRQAAVVNSFAGLGYVFTGTKRSTRIGARAGRLHDAESTRQGSSHRRNIFQNKDDFEALEACGLVTSKDTTIVPGSGVSEEKFVPAPEAPGDPMVLLAGRVLGDKGIVEFVEAAAVIKSRGIKARFVLAGKTDPANPSSIPDTQLQKMARCRRYRVVGPEKRHAGRYGAVTHCGFAVLSRGISKDFARSLCERATRGCYRCSRLPRNCARR